MKLMRTLMMSIILILIKVQANDLSSISYHPSSLPILLSHPSVLDNYNPRGPLHTCLGRKFQHCEEKKDPELFAKCIIDEFCKMLI